MVEQVTHYTTSLTSRAGETEIQDLFHLPSCVPWHDKAVFVQKKGYTFLIRPKVPSTGPAVYLGGCSHSEGVAFPNLLKRAPYGLIIILALGFSLHSPLSTHLGSMMLSIGQREKQIHCWLPLAPFWGNCSAHRPTYQHLVWLLMNGPRPPSGSQAEPIRPFCLKTGTKRCRVLSAIGES